VSSCPNGSGPLFEWSDESGQVITPGIDARVYPNPSTGKVYVEFSEAPALALITVRDILGYIMTENVISGDRIVELDLDNITTQQILFVTIAIVDQPLQTLKLLLVD
jgi:hypothetical protein